MKTRAPRIAVSPVDTTGMLTLPMRLTTFVGRERELRELAAIAQANRLVTLTGPGGSGKTRLAIELAARLRALSTQPQSFVGLAPIRDASLLPSTIASSIGLRLERSRPILDSLIDQLAGPGRLLILDNLEHLPDGTPTIAVLLAHCPNLQIVATSRAPLRIRGERPYRVAPLALPESADLQWLERLERTEAVSLFVDRASLVDPLFALTTENAGAVVEICRRLDGLPLAIELAAARTRVLSPKALLRRLERRLPLLSNGPADAPARQRTLRDAIAWSYDLLEPDDREIFARLSIFVGGFTLVAAEAVIPDFERVRLADILDAVGRLADHNLLTIGRSTEGEHRFSLLETVREFALDHLTEQRAEELRARHAGHFLSFAEAAQPEIGGPEHGLWLGRVTDELDNHRAALTWARDRRDAELFCRLTLALSKVLIEHVDHEEAGRWLHVAETFLPAVEPRLRAAVLHQLADYEIAHGGDRDRMELLFAEALRINEELGEVARMADALSFLGPIAMDRGDRETAKDRIERAWLLTRSIEDRVKAAHLLGDIAVGSMGILDPERSRALATEALKLGRERRVPEAIAKGIGCLGLADLLAGQPHAAIARLSEWRKLLAEMGSRPSETWAISVLGLAHLRAGDLRQAGELVLDAALRARELDWVFIGLSALESASDWLGAVGLAQDATVFGPQSTPPGRSRSTAPSPTMWGY